MTTYQSHLLHYFGQYVEKFTFQLLIDTPDKFTVIEDVVPCITRCIDNQLRKDIALYEPHTTGYDHHIDMLIEINRPLDDDFKLSLVKMMNSVFNQ